ncbi:MAG: hypothetical protein ACK5QX_10810, partial [bacterium]
MGKFRKTLTDEQVRDECASYILKMSGHPPCRPISFEHLPGSVLLDHTLGRDPKQLESETAMRYDSLIGDTGFVGSTLSSQHSFSAKFNSRNINTIGEYRFDTVVCAAAPGSMLQANRAPERDRAAIEALTAQLRSVVARRFVLISSIAVLADFAGGDDEGTQAFEETLAYGRHRRQLEAFCESHFENCLVVRLPALFGPGLRKNFVFDLMNPVPTLLPEARLETLLERLPPMLREALAARYAPD